MTNTQYVRLAKLMSLRGLCSRREAENFISNGWVKVNGALIKEIVTKVDINCQIDISNQATNLQSNLLTIALNKPIGYASSSTFNNYPTALSLIKPSNIDNNYLSKFNNNNNNNNIDNISFPLKKLAPAGRLDIESSGLMIFTQDGRIAKLLIEEKTKIEKEYIVKVEGKITSQKISLLNYGLSLDGQKLLPSKVKATDKNRLIFILKQGKKRQIRRMCQLVDLKVTKLKRIRIGKIILGNLQKGKWRFLNHKEKFI